MLTEIYIEAPLDDEKLADQVWEAWDKGEIDDPIACTAWMIIATKNAGRRPERSEGGSVCLRHNPNGRSR